MRRTLIALIVGLVTGAIALTGCAQQPDQDGTAAALTRLAPELAAIDGVLELTNLSMSEFATNVDPTSIEVAIRVEGDRDALAAALDEALAAIWRSDVPEIASLDGHASGPDAQAVAAAEVLGVAPTPEVYEARYGPRP